MILFSAYRRLMVGLLSFKRNLAGWLESFKRLNAVAYLIVEKKEKISTTQDGNSCKCVIYRQWIFLFGITIYSWVQITQNNL